MMMREMFRERISTKIVLEILRIIISRLPRGSKSNDLRGRLWAPSVEVRSRTHSADTPSHRGQISSAAVIVLDRATPDEHRLDCRLDP